jgi:hypothetical protein
MMQGSFWRKYLCLQQNRRKEGAGVEIATVNCESLSRAPKATPALPGSRLIAGGWQTVVRQPKLRKLIPLEF